MRDLLRTEGIDAALRKAFAIYMIGHDRPMADVLSARPKDITPEYAGGLAGMTDEAVMQAKLEGARAGIVLRLERSCLVVSPAGLRTSLKAGCYSALQFRQLVHAIIAGALAGQATFQSV